MCSHGYNSSLPSESPCEDTDPARPEARCNRPPRAETGQVLCRQPSARPGASASFLSCSFYKSNYVQRFHYSRPVRRGTVDPENEFAVSTYLPLSSLDHFPEPPRPTRAGVCQPPNGREFDSEPEIVMPAPADTTIPVPGVSHWVRFLLFGAFPLSRYNPGLV